MKETMEESFDGGLPTGVNPFAIIVDERWSPIFAKKWPDYFQIVSLPTKDGGTKEILQAISNPNVSGLTQTQAANLLQMIFNSDGVYACAFAVLKPYAHILEGLWQFVYVVDPKRVKDGVCFARDCHYLSGKPGMPAVSEVESHCLAKWDAKDFRPSTTIYLHPHLLEKLERWARRERKTQSQLLEEIVGRAMCDCSKCKPT